MSTTEAIYKLLYEEQEKERVTSLTSTTGSGAASAVCSSLILCFVVFLLKHISSLYSIYIVDILSFQTVRFQVLMQRMREHLSSFKFTGLGGVPDKPWPTHRHRCQPHHPTILQRANNPPTRTLFCYETNQKKSDCPTWNWTPPPPTRNTMKAILMFNPRASRWERPRGKPHRKVSLHWSSWGAGTRPTTLAGTG